MKKILIIAGSDPSGGAGFQTDIKVAVAHKVYAGAVVASLTAQNTAGVAGGFNAPVSFLKAQLEAVFDDISFDAIKIGMLANVENIECVADVLAKKAADVPVILDPVMVATSGDLLLEENAVAALKSLAAQAFLITPNADEAAFLAGFKIENVDDMKRAALRIKGFGVQNVLIKGGHLCQASLLRAQAKQFAATKNGLPRFARNDAEANCWTNKQIFNILLDKNNKFHIIKNKRLDVGDVHGTGCALASAIACNLALGKNLLASTKLGNSYIYKQILKAQKIGKGAKILKHF